MSKPITLSKEELTELILCCVRNDLNESEAVNYMNEFVKDCKQDENEGF